MIFSTIARSTDGGDLIAQRPATDLLAIAGALLLVLGSLLVGRLLMRISIERDRAVESFAGGVSLAFVLLELFVELAEGAHTEAPNAVVHAGPSRVHTIATLILFGAVSLLVADVYARKSRESRHAYRVTAVPESIYMGLVGAALDEELRTSPRGFTVFWLAMVLHLGVTQHHMLSTFPNEHRGAALRWSSCTPLVGAALWAWMSPSHATFYALLALVAGATILITFRDEIPPAKEVRTLAFFGGLVVFGALVQARWWL